MKYLQGACKCISHPSPLVLDSSSFYLGLHLPQPASDLLFIRSTYVPHVVLFFPFLIMTARYLKVLSIFKPWIHCLSIIQVILFFNNKTLTQLIKVFSSKKVNRNAKNLDLRGEIRCGISLHLFISCVFLTGHFPLNLRSLENGFIFILVGHKAIGARTKACVAVYHQQYNEQGCISSRFVQWNNSFSL